MANLAPKTAHLKPTQWKPGQSGNPQGKTPGIKHLSSIIQNVLCDEDKIVRLIKQARGVEDFEGTPAEAIVNVVMLKALNGDLKAAEWLAKYGWGSPSSSQKYNQQLLIETQRMQFVATVNDDRLNFLES